MEHARQCCAICLADLAATTNVLVMGFAIKKSANVSVCFTACVMQGFAMFLMFLLSALAFFLLAQTEYFFVTRFVY